MTPARAGLLRAAELLAQAGGPVADATVALDQSLVAELEARGITAEVMGTLR